MMGGGNEKKWLMIAIIQTWEDKEDQTLSIPSIPWTTKNDFI